MPKFLFYTDCHASGQTPEHRTDDYPKAITAKVREVYSIAKSHNCDFAINGGDIFDTHRIFNFDIIGDIMETIEDADIPTFAAIGQHDLYGYNQETYKTSTMAFVERRCSKLKVLWQPMVSHGVSIQASHVWSDIKADAKIKVDGMPSILVAHHLLTNRKMPYQIVNTAELAVDCNFDLIVAGDLHDGFETHREGKTWFCNPGALARQAINDADRPIQVAIIEIGDGLKMPRIELVPLQSAKPGKEVFGERVGEIIRKEEKLNATTFVDEMLLLESESVDIHALLQKLGKQRNIRQDVLNYLASKRAEALEQADVKA